MATEALQAFRKAQELSGGAGYSSALATAYAVSGQKKEALRMLAEIQERAGREAVSAYNVAMVYAGLGEKDKALTWLEKSYANREARLVNIQAHPRFEALHSEPRFADLLRRIGMGP